MIPAEARKKIAACWSGAVAWDFVLAEISSLKVGGPAWAVIRPDTVDALSYLVQGLEREAIRWWLIGRGSNVLIADSGLPGVVIQLGGGFSTAEFSGLADGTWRVRAGGGCLLTALGRKSVRRNLHGLEFVIGIPGSLGGAITMNAGAWGRTIGQLVESVTVLTASGKRQIRKGKDIDFGYRSWGGAADEIIVAASLILTPGDPVEIARDCQWMQQQRSSRQPLDLPSSGSFFKNPPGDAAGRLIEAAGLKGMQCGGARVSEKHANFLVNTGKATAADMLALMAAVQKEVLAQFGVALEPEVKFLGFGDTA